MTYIIGLKKPPREVEEVIEGLPTEDEVKEKIRKLLNNKEYDVAARIMVYYSIAKINVDDFVGRVKAYVDATPEERKKMLEALKNG